MTSFHPKKSLGQNFLRHPEIAEKIARAGNVTLQDTIIEVGPGFGILTKTLAKKAKKVIAIELDQSLKPALQNAIKGLPRHDREKIELHFTDALKYQPPNLPYKLIANIPYSITSPLLRHFLKEVRRKPKLCVLMVQKEVAQKICAKPPDMNILALNVQMFAKPRYLFTVGKGAFQPRPKVDSAVIEITPFQKPLIHDPEKLKQCFALVSAAFFQKRKALCNSLKKIYGKKTEEILRKAGIDPLRRPETLMIHEWLMLTGVS